MISRLFRLFLLRVLPRQLAPLIVGWEVIKIVRRMRRGPGRTHVAVKDAGRSTPSR